MMRFQRAGVCARRPLPVAGFNKYSRSSQAAFALVLLAVVAEDAIRQLFA